VVVKVCREPFKPLRLRRQRGFLGIPQSDPAPARARREGRVKSLRPLGGRYRNGLICRKFSSEIRTGGQKAKIRGFAEKLGFGAGRRSCTFWAFGRPKTR
jgi:hypothetical protein